jgi:hypothetical protein
MKAYCVSLMAAAVFSGAILTPITASAQSSADQEYHHRQQTKNEWRNIAIGAGSHVEKCDPAHC